MTFTLNTDQSLAILKSVPASTRCFGEFSLDADDDRFLGFRDDVISAFTHAGQNDIAPRWRTENGLYDLWSLTAQVTDDRFTLNSQEFCFQLIFEITDGEDAKDIPVFWSLPSHLAFKPGSMAQSRTKDTSRSVLTFAREHVRECDLEIVTRAVEDGYYSGVRWSMATGSGDKHRICEHCSRIASSQGQAGFRDFFISDEDSQPAIRVATVVQCGPEATKQTRHAEDFWLLLGCSDLPSSRWVLGFCAGVAQICTSPTH